MAKGKHKTPKDKCKAQFMRTVARTGKWRGVKAEDYVKQKNKKKKRDPEESLKFIAEISGEKLDYVRAQVDKGFKSKRKRR